MRFLSKAKTRILAFLLAAASLTTVAYASDVKVYTELITENEELLSYDWDTDNRTVRLAELAPRDTWFVDGQTSVIKYAKSEINSIIFTKGYVSDTTEIAKWNAAKDEDGDGKLDDDIQCFLLNDTIYYGDVERLDPADSEFLFTTSTMNWSDKPYLIDPEVGTISAPNYAVVTTDNTVVDFGQTYYAYNPGDTEYYILNIDTQYFAKVDVNSKSGKKLIVSAEEGGIQLSEDSSYFLGKGASAQGFLYCYNVNFDTQIITSGVKTFQNAFDGMGSILSLDLSKFNTSNVRDMSYMFLNMSNVLDINCARFSTGNVTTFEGTFANTQMLQHPAVDEWDVSASTTFQYMFLRSRLARFPAENWSVGNSSNFAYMFASCLGLPEADLSKWNMTGITGMNSADGFKATESMFDTCRNMHTLTLPATKYVGKRFAADCRSLETIKFSNTATDPLNMYNSVYDYATWNGSEDSKPDGCFCVSELIITEITSDNNTVFGYDWRADNRARTSVMMPPEDTWWDASKLKSAVETINIVQSYEPIYTDQSWNAGIGGSPEIKCYVSADGKNVYLSSQSALQLVANPNSKGVFSGFSNVKEINGLDMLKSSEETPVLDISHAFDGCSKLVKAEIENIDLSTVTTTDYMYKDCRAMEFISHHTRLDSVASTEGMFQGCSSMKSFSFDIPTSAPLTNVSHMLEGCQELKSVYDYTWLYNLPNVTDASYLFADCIGMNSEDGILSITNNNPNLTDISGLLKDCTQLITVNLDNFDFSNITKNESMFEHCTSMESLTLPASLEVIDPRFAYDCPNLDFLKCDVSEIDDIEMKAIAGDVAGMVYVENEAPITVQTDNVQLRTYAYATDNRVVTFKSNKPFPVSIMVVKNPDKMDYVYGDDFDPIGLQVDVTYSDDSVVRLGDDVSELARLDFENDTNMPTGYNDIIISFTDCDETVSTDLSVYVSKIPQNLEIVNPPNKTKYEAGEDLDPTGMIVEVTFTDGTIETFEPIPGVVIPGLEIEPTDDLEVDDTLVKVTYTGGGVECSDTTPITVTRIPIRVTVTKLPNKTIYLPGEIFNPYGMEFEVEYKHGITISSTEDPTVAAGMHSTSNTPLVDGQISAPMEYVEGDYKFDISIPIKVRILNQIYIQQPPITTSYVAGDLFDNKGMVVVAQYSNGDKITLTYPADHRGYVGAKETDYIIVGGTVYDSDPMPAASGIRSSTTGIQIYYTENGHTSTVTQPIRVKAIDHIKVVTPPDKTVYIPGENFDRTGMKVAAVYKDGTSEILDDSQYTIPDGNNLQLDRTYVTVKVNIAAGAGEDTVDIVVRVSNTGTQTYGTYDMTDEDYEVIRDWNSVTVKVIGTRTSGISLSEADLANKPVRQITYYVDASYGSPVISGSAISFYGISPTGQISGKETVTVVMEDTELEEHIHEKWSDRSIYMQFKDSTSPYYVEGYSYQVDYGSSMITDETGKAILNKEGESVITVQSFGYDNTHSAKAETILKIDRSAPEVTWEVEERPGTGTAKVIIRARDNESGIDYIQLPPGGWLRIGAGDDIENPADYEEVTEVKKLEDTTYAEYVLPGNAFYTIDVYNNAGLKTSKTFDFNYLKEDYYIRTATWLETPVRGLPLELRVTVGANVVKQASVPLRIEYAVNGNLANLQTIYQDAVGITTDKDLVLDLELNLPTQEDNPTLIITINPEGEISDADWSDNVYTLTSTGNKYDFIARSIYVDNINVVPNQSIPVEFTIEATGLTTEVSVPVDYYVIVGGVETKHSTKMVTFGPSATIQKVDGIVSAPSTEGAFVIKATVNGTEAGVGTVLGEVDRTNNSASIINMNASMTNLGVNINGDLVVNGFTYGYASTEDSGVFTLEMLNITENVQYIVIEGNKYTEADNSAAANFKVNGVGSNTAKFQLKDIYSGDKVPVAIGVISADGKYTKEYNIYITKFTGNIAMDLTYTYNRHVDGRVVEVTETKRLDADNHNLTIYLPNDGALPDSIQTRMTMVDNQATITKVQGTDNTNPLKNTAQTVVTIESDPSRPLYNKGTLTASVKAPGDEAIVQDYTVTFSKVDQPTSVIFVNATEVSSRTYGRTGFLQGGTFTKYGNGTTSVVQANRDGVTSGIIIQIKVDDPNIEQILQGYVQLDATGTQYPITWNSFSGPQAIKASDAEYGYVNIPITNSLNGSYGAAKIVVNSYKDDTNAIVDDTIIGFSVLIDTSMDTVDIEVGPEEKDAAGKPTGKVPVTITDPAVINFSNTTVSWYISRDGGNTWTSPQYITNKNFYVEGSGVIKLKVMLEDKLGNKSDVIETITFAENPEGTFLSNIFQQKTRLADYYYIGTNRNSDATVSGDMFDFE